MGFVDGILSIYQLMPDFATISTSNGKPILHTSSYHGYSTSLRTHSNSSHPSSTPAVLPEEWRRPPLDPDLQGPSAPQPTCRAWPRPVDELGQEVRFWSSRDNQFGLATRCLILCWWGLFQTALNHLSLLKMGCYKSWTDLNAGEIGWNSPLTTTSRSRAPWVNICSHHLFCWCCWWTARLHREGCILWFLDDVFHIDGFPLLKPWLSKVSQWGCEAGGRWTETAMASQLAGTQRPAPKWATSNCIWWVSSQMYNTFIYITYDPPKDYSPNSQALASKKGMWMAINP